MSIIVFLIVGGLVGYVASRLMGRHEGILASIIIGIVGSFVGSLLSRVITGGDKSYLAFDTGAIIWSLVGSVVLVAAMNAFQKRSHHAH